MTRRLWYHPESECYIQTLTDSEVDDELAANCDEVTSVLEHEVRFIDQLNEERSNSMALNFSKNKGNKPSSKGGKSRFDYKPIADEDMERDATKRTGGGDSVVKNDVKQFRPQEGLNEIRVLPSTWEDARSVALDVPIHYGIGADNSQFLCVKKMDGSDCAVHDAQKEAAADGDDELAKAMNPGTRAGLWVIDRKNEADGPMLWLAPYQNFYQEMLQQARDPKDRSYLQIQHPEEGYDISFNVKGKGISTKYSGIKVARNSSPISDDEDTMKEWLDYIEENPIPSVLLWPDYDYVRAALDGGVRVRDEDGSEALRGAKGGKEGGGKPKARREDDAPRKSGKPSLSKRDPDPEPESGGEFDPSDYDWESIHALDEAELEELIEAAEIPDEEYADASSLEEVQDIVCKLLEIEEPEPEPKSKPSAKGGAGKSQAGKLAALRKNRR